MSTVVSQRYARALMNLAEKAQQVEQVAAEIDGFADLLGESGQLSSFLAEARVPQSAKEGAIAEILKKGEASELVSTFVRYISHKRRLLLMEDIREDFHRLADERSGRAQAGDTVSPETRSFLENVRNPCLAKPFRVRDVRETILQVLPNGT